VRIATYNVNGINGRLAVLLRWLAEAEPDIACLQELKAPEERFPEAAIAAAGYGAIAAEGVPIFLDLKLHDIPATVEGAARNAAALRVSMLTVHALGGPAMVSAAVEGAAEGAPGSPPMVVAVTVLSSVGGESLASPSSLAYEAREAGAGGVVVSGDHVEDVRNVLGESACLVVPGVRPAGSGSNDHVRVLSPRAAMEAGADYLVVGRPVTEAADPASAARGILKEIGRA